MKQVVGVDKEMCECRDDGVLVKFRRVWKSEF